MALYYNLSSLTGDPAGIKVMENPTKTLKAILFPRRCLTEFNNLPEAKQTGVYILYHTADKNEQPHVYIGQTGYAVSSRILDHNRNRDFWNYALVFVEKGDFLNMNSAHTKIIESILIQKAKECNVAIMDNATGSNPPRIQDADLYAAQTWAEEVVVISKLLGLSFFIPADNPALSQKSDEQKKRSPTQTVKPKSFSITGYGDYPFESWVSATILLCNMAIKAHGFQEFSQAVTAYSFFGKRATKRKVFAYSEEEMRGFSFHKFEGGLYLLTNYSANSLQRINQGITTLFPDCQIKFHY